MATLNTSSESGGIQKSYQSVVNATPPAGNAASSPTYGQWAVFSVSAPLANAFVSDSGKESVLKVQSTGEGELIDLIDEFSEGRIQFAFAKVKDPNTTLPKSVLIGWCGEGVPERTKGYFTSHLAVASKLFHGYHVQITARNDSDLTPENIIKKVQDASGSKYSGGGMTPDSKPSPPMASKPVFQPSSSSGASSAFNPLASRSRFAAPQDTNLDQDGWGTDAPQVTRTQLEKVQPAYRPTKVDMAALTSSKPEPSAYRPLQKDSNGAPDVVKGAYQPIGKVDIAAIRAQAQQSGRSNDDRPTTVKGAYEPVGKVDIAAIRARAQPSSAVAPSAVEPAQTGESEEAQPKSLADRSAAFTQSERLTSLPKPKVANRYGGGGSNFSGTKAPLPGGFEAKSLATSAPVGVAGKNFADEGGKTPAQIWAEKKARERGDSGAGLATPAPMASQASGTGAAEWESGYVGKKWAPVPTTRTGGSGVSANKTGDEQEQEEQSTAPSGGVGAIRDRFKDGVPMGASAEPSSASMPPPMDFSNKPSAGAARGVPMPGLPQRPAEEEQRLPTPPPQPPRSPTPEPDELPQSQGSPVRIAMPVARSREEPMEAPEDRFSPPPMPVQSIARAIPATRDMDEEPAVASEDPARAASHAAATSTFGAAAVDRPGQQKGKTAIAEYDYEKDEEDQLALIEGERILNIEMVDEDWWLGENAKGERGLFPSNYVKVVDGEDDNDNAAEEEEEQQQQHAAPTAASTAASAATGGKHGQTATAQYDYEALEENELSFPDGALITNVEFPDDGWWLGEYDGHKGLFPANYVELNE